MSDFARRYVRYPVEAAAVRLFFGLFGLLPTATASAIGGRLWRTIGPRLRINQRAVRNIDFAMPEISAAERDRIVRGMWDNFGRIFAEYPHIDDITKSGNDTRVEIAGRHHADCVTDPAGGGILISGHFANWEIFALTAEGMGIPYSQVYRPANNPLVDRIAMRMRRLQPDRIIPKGPAGARKTVEILRRGGRIGMLVDQKMNDGIAVPFFGHDAMTAPAVAHLARRYGCPVVPVWLERLDGCRFRITFHPPMRARRSEEPSEDIRAMMIEINDFLEQRIRERPDQWLWLHRRWPEENPVTPSASASASGPPAGPDRDASATD